MALLQPLLRLLLAQPDLFVEHLAGYAAVLTDDAAATLAQWQRRWRLRLLAWAAFAASGLLAGQALLLLALLPLPALNGPGALLLAVPVLPLLLGAWALRAARLALRAGAGAAPGCAGRAPFAQVRSQLAADLALMHAGRTAPAPACPPAPSAPAP